MQGKIHPDVYAGLFFIILGVIGLYLGWDYAFGTTQRIGPGFMPKLLCWSMIGVGGIVVITGLAQRDWPAMEPWASGPLAAILCAVLVFTAALEGQGLPLSVAALVLISSTAMPAPGRIETILLNIGASAVLLWLTFNNLTLKNIVAKTVPALSWLFAGPLVTVFAIIAVIAIVAALLHRLLTLRWREVGEVLLTTTVLATMSVVVFVRALGLPLKVWPEWLLWN